MKRVFYFLTILLVITSYQSTAQNNDDYLEFDDTKNTIHGVYLGISTYYGEIDGKSTYLLGGKVAYVADRKFEVGFAGVAFYSDQESQGIFSNIDLYGGYGGFHLEPIFFGDSKFNLSIPILIGAGGVAYVDQEFNEFDIDDWEWYFVVEPGLSVQYNISRFIQVEAGVKYRFSSDLSLYPGGVNNINGFSAGIGMKFGVFNMRRD